MRKYVPDHHLKTRDPGGASTKNHLKRREVSGRDQTLEQSMTNTKTMFLFLSYKHTHKHAHGDTVYLVNVAGGQSHTLQQTSDWLNALVEER